MKPGTGGTWRVLVVEDDADTASMISRLIGRRFGADVSLARDCASARRALAGGEIDAVILDYQLPDGTGIQLLGELPAGERPAAIVVTGHGDEETAVQAFRLHASGYLVKDRRLHAMLPEVLGGAFAEISLRRTQEELRRSREAERTLLNELEERVAERTGELEKANEALRALSAQVQRQADMLDEILSASPDHFYLVERSGRCIYASRAAALSLGLGQDEMTGRYWWDLGLPDDTMRRLDIMRESVFTGGPPATSKLQLLTVEGSREFECTAHPVHGPGGEVTAVVVTARDTGGRKQAG